MSGRVAVRGMLLCAGVLLVAGGVALSREPAQADALSTLALALAVMVSAAKLGAEAAGRMGQPAVLGELVAGIFLGNVGLAGLQRLGSDPYLDALARLGMLLLLFEVGLQLSVRDLFRVGPSSLLVALCGTVSSFFIGWAAAAWLLNTAPAGHVFVGAAITATSVGITARVFKDLDASRSSEAEIVLGAAIVDDVLALVILALVTGWLGARQAGHAFQGAPAIALVAKVLGFLTLAVLLGVRLTPGWFRYAAKLRTQGVLLALGLCFCFFFSWAASAIGLAPLVGAFAAGLILEDVHSEAFVQRGERSLSELIEPMTAFLVPVFFVLVGFRTNIRALAHPSLIGFSVSLVVAAVAGKLSCALGVLVPGARKITVAIGMMPRGEVTLIFAAIGSSLRLGGEPLLNESTYTALIAVVIVTTLLTPVALKLSARSISGPAGVG